MPIFVKNPSTILVVENGGRRQTDNTNIQAQTQSTEAPWHKFCTGCLVAYVCIDKFSSSEFHPHELCENCFAWDTKLYWMIYICRFVVANCRSCLQKKELYFIRNVGKIHRSPRRYTQTIVILTVGPVVSLYLTYLPSCLVLGKWPKWRTILYYVFIFIFNYILSLLMMSTMCWKHVQG